MRLLANQLNHSSYQPLWVVNYSVSTVVNFSIDKHTRNTIWGVVAGWEEVITSLELTLELTDSLDNLTPEIVCAITDRYKAMAGNPSQVQVLVPAEVEALVTACAETELDRGFLERAYADVGGYHREQLA